MRPSRRQELGRHGEKLARRHLESKGYRVLETNYHSKSGEIDLIAEHLGTLVFIEVRTRGAGMLGTPEESVTASKRLRLVAVAEEYLQAADTPNAEWRIDVVALEVDGGRRLVRLDVIREGRRSIARFSPSNRVVQSVPRRWGKGSCPYTNTAAIPVTKSRASSRDP